MSITEIIAQAIGIVGMVVIVLSWQGKSQKTVIGMQLCGNILFSVNYLMLGGIVGGLLNAIGAVRGLVYYFKDKLHSDRLPWFVGFVASYIAAYVLNFTVFGKEPAAVNLLIELLPVIGMVALNIGFRLKNASDVRRCGLVASPAWLVYNLTVPTWGGVIGEVLSLTSITVGMLRHDKKAQK